MTTKGATPQEPASQASPDFGSYDPFEEPLAQPQEAAEQQPAARPPVAAKPDAPPAAVAGPAPGRDPVLSEYTDGAEPQDDEAEAPAGDEEGAKSKPDRHSAGILAELRSMRDENKELKGALSVLLAERQGRATTPAKEEAPEPEAVPDPLHDPKGYDDYVQRKNDERVAAVQSQAAHDLAMMRFNSSEQIARIRHGDELVDKARQWVISQGPAAGQHFTAQSDPMGAAIAAYQRAQVVERVGPDPDAYERQVEERVLARLRAAGIAIPESPPAAAPAAPAGRQPRAAAPSPNPAAVPRRQAPAAPLTATLANQPRGGAAGQEVAGSFSDFAADFIN
ncbi:MAG: hypothetical protein E6Q97_31155 [Desulfurellales bacterium]|nr:MAG: hypothetical protein E6Q97_31155 [Desulfurellales bacterium]